MDMKCINCGKEYIIPENGNWLKDGTVGKKAGSINSSKFCCFKCGQEYQQKKRKKSFISPFNNPDIRKKAINTIKERYGVDNVFANKDIKEKIRHTNIERYGVDNIAKCKDIQDKINNTCNIKYNGRLFGSKEIKEKIYKTNIEKYGNKYAQKSIIIKDKIAQTNLSRYGVIAPMQNDSIKQKSIETCLEKYNLPYNCLRDECKVAGHIISKINLSWKESIEELGYRVELEKLVNNKIAFDLYIPELDLLIDINPTISHQSTRDIDTYFDKIKPRDRLYHKEKRELALNNGYTRCIMIWDWDDKNKILNNLKKTIKVYARKCNIKEVSEDEANTFLNTYHYQNTCKGQNIRLGLYYKDELIQIMTFGKPRYNNKYKYELLRLCTKYNYTIIGGSNKLFKYFKDNFSKNSIISYCDLSKFNGKVYEGLGFKLLKTSAPSKHWYNINTHRHITDNLLLQRGYSSLHNDTGYNKGENNINLMRNNGYLEVYDCGQATYIIE